MAKAMGCITLQSYDVGIAGIHRVFPALKQMMSENVGAIVVVAGMEGALPSVVTSMVNVPVVGVPTSVGYGFGSDGVAALASMLQSCTLGLSVVNIDNGIGAGAFAALICNQLDRRTNTARTITSMGTRSGRRTRTKTSKGKNAHNGPKGEKQ
jgi:NCAIR mutase (PurE)-related protein